MKLLTKISFLAAAVASMGSSAAFADDQQLQNRLAAQCAQDSVRSSNSPTVALYSTRNEIQSGAAQDSRSEIRFQIRSNSHGQVTGSYESVQ
jgi:hypothetical protein